MFYILAVGICLSSIVIGFADKMVRTPGGIFIIPGMLGEGLRSPKEVFNGLLLITLISFGLCRYKLAKLDTKSLIYLVATLCWAYFVCYISKYEFSFTFLYYMTLGLMAIYVISSFDYKKLKVDRLLRFLAYVGVVQCFWATLQALCLDQWFRVASNDWSFGLGDGALSHRTVSFIANPSFFGIFLGMILPVYIYIKERWAKLALIMCLIVIYICDSTTAYIVAAISSLFYLFFCEKRKFLIMAALFLIGLMAFSVYTLNNKYILKHLIDTTGRTEVLKTGYRHWVNIDKTSSLGPITGHGLRSWEQEISPLNKDVHLQWHEAHNDFFQIAYELGIIGLGLYLILIRQVFKSFFSNITREKTVAMAFLIGFLISSLTLFPLYSSCIVLYAVIFTGIVLNKEKKNV